MNPTGCKICLHEKAQEIDDLILGKTPYRAIIKQFPELNLYNISGHKKNHLGAVGESAPPEVDPAELDKMPAPDVVAIVERTVNEYELIKRQRQLTPQEERERARFMEYLLKIALYKLEAKQKSKVDTTWIDEAMEKLRRGDYDP